MKKLQNKRAHCETTKMHVQMDAMGHSGKCCFKEEVSGSEEVRTPY